MKKFDMRDINQKITRLLRGYFYKLFIKKSGKKLFIGKRTDIKYRQNISLGNNVNIHDYVEINAQVKNSVTLGNNIHIGKYSIIKCTGEYTDSIPSIKIGDNFGCGDFCYFGCAGGITIGNNVIMGQNVRFHAQNHMFDLVDIPINNQGTTQKGITIEDDCWIGAGSVFLDGITVGKGCVIGSNTLVNKNIQPYSVVVGNPARVIKKRK